MPTEPITAAAQSVSGISNHWQVLALIVIGLFGVLALWVWKTGGDSKKMVEMSDELERKRTESRKLERDKQMSEMETRVAGRVDSLSNAFNTHLDGHRERDTRVQNVVDRLDARLYQIELNMVRGDDITAMKNDLKNMEKLVTVIHTILEERDKSKGEK